jgi:hypothetical protein
MSTHFSFVCLFPLRTVSQGHSTSNQYRKETFPTRPPQNRMIFCEIVVPVGVSIPAKFYCFIATRFLRANIQNCKKKTRFFSTRCLRKSVITSALIEIQSSFYAHFKCPFQWPITPIHWKQLCFQGIQIWPLTWDFSKCVILIKKILCACNCFLKHLQISRWHCNGIGFCEAVY